MKKFGSWLMQVLRGAVIGLANVIPGVSGGTMMVSMGIYDTIIWAINHLFKQFKKCIITLLPYLVGMAAAILIGAKVLDTAFEVFALPTNALFIGLILGSLPFILHETKGSKIGWQGVLIFVLFFALVVVQAAFQKKVDSDITLNVIEIIKLFFLGAVASATMVIPGVSGSMMLKTFGYYEYIVTRNLGHLTENLVAGDWNAVLGNVGVLLPFGIGIVVGFFGIAKIIAFLFKRWKGWTYCGILGMVVASPVAIVIGLIYDNKFAGFNALWGVECALFLAIGIIIALLFGENPDKAPDALESTGAPEAAPAEKQE